MKNFFEDAKAYHAAGFRLTACTEEAGATRFVSWKKWADGPQTAEEIDELFEGKEYTRIAVIFPIGGRLEAIDVDTKHDGRGTIIADFEAAVKEIEEARGLSGILEKVVQAKTKSGGRHYIYQAPNVEGNQKLTQRDGNREAVIETRGPGGLLFVAPSPGYEFTRGNLLTGAPELTEEERGALIDAARILAEVQTEPGGILGAHQAHQGGGGGTRPGDDYNEKTDILALLEGYGWTIAARGGRSGWMHLRRPGAKTKNHDASIKISERTGKAFFYPFTTSTEFTPGVCYSAFGIYATIEHRGNYSAAAAALAALGYGRPAAGEQVARAVERIPAGTEKVYIFPDNKSAEEAGTRGATWADAGTIGAVVEGAAEEKGARYVFVIEGGDGATLERLRALFAHMEERGRFMPVMIGKAGAAEADYLSAAKWAARYFERRAAEIAADMTGGNFDRDILRVHYKEEITALHRLLPVSETPYFEHLLSDILEAYFLTWEEIRHDAQNLRELETRRAYERTAGAIAGDIAALYSAGKGEEAEGKIEELRTARINSRAARFSTLLRPATLEEIRAGLTRADGLKTSYTLTRESGGAVPLEFPGGAISVIAGATGHGKTAFMMNAALDIVERYPDKIFHFFTLEEAAETIYLHLLNIYIGEAVGYPESVTNTAALAHFLRTGSTDKISLSHTEMVKEKTARFFAEIAPRLIVTYPEERTAEYFCDAVRYAHRGGKVGGVFVDYIQLLNLSEPGRLDRHKEMKQIVGKVKDTAIETGLPLVFIAQFNRTVINEETAGDYTAIGEAGDIERIAALIVSVWNRKYNKGEFDAKEEIFLKVLKWRNNAAGYAGAFPWRGNLRKVDHHNQAPHQAANTVFSSFKRSQQ